MRLLKSHPLLSLVNSYVVDSPQPANISYMWNFGSLLATCLGLQLVTGIILAMHYTPNVDLAFISVEHIMRDVNYGWLLRYMHANGASFFFIFVYLHIGRGLYYGSYRAPRTLTWSIGVIIFILMMATAFLGYVLPYGQMSLWGELAPWGLKETIVMFLYTPILLFFVPRTKAEKRIGPHNLNVISIIVGSLLGDSYAEKHGNGTRITFYVESKNIDYLIFLWEIFNLHGYCSDKKPTPLKRTSKGSVRYVARFKTFVFSSLDFIRESFYVNGVKIVPRSIIETYFSAQSLAIWLMDDGSRVGKALKLSTNCFTHEDNLWLADFLTKKYGIKVSVQSAGVPGQYHLYVWEQSMPLLKDIVLPYMHKSMYYKLGLN